MTAATDRDSSAGSQARIELPDVSGLSVKAAAVRYVEAGISVLALWGVKENGGWRQSERCRAREWRVYWQRRQHRLLEGFHQTQPPHTRGSGAAPRAAS